jgi:hypothetical protein
MEKEALKNSKMDYQSIFHCHTRGFFAFPCQRLVDSNGNVIFEECATPRRPQRTSFMRTKDWEKPNKLWCYENCGKVQLPGQHKEFSIDITYLSEEKLQEYFELRPLYLVLHDLEQHPETLGLLESHTENKIACEALREYKAGKKILEENGVSVEELVIEL